MRSRKRRSVFDVISLVMLEVGILGLFVILAQPQLRDALFELLSPASHQQARAAAQRPESLSSQTVGDTTLAATGNPAVTSSAQFASPASPATSAIGSAVNYLDRTIAHVASLPLPTNQLMPATQSAIPTGQHVAAYTPWEHYESFQVAVPSSGLHEAATESSSAANPGTWRSSGFGTVTQLTPNQWNIGSAPPFTQPSATEPSASGQWIPAAPLHSAQSSYRDVYPPPYGTQSPWR